MVSVCLLRCPPLNTGGGASGPPGGPALGHVVEASRHRKGGVTILGKSDCVTQGGDPHAVVISRLTFSGDV